MSLWASREQREDDRDQLQRERDQAIAERDRLAEEVVRLRDQLEGVLPEAEDDDEKDQHRKAGR